MELKAFIEETLCQIAEAMNGAQSRLEYLGVNINPPYMVEEGEYVDASHRSSTVHCLQKVDFDIAVTASSGMKKDGELSISVLQPSWEAGPPPKASTPLCLEFAFSLLFGCRRVNLRACELY